MQRDAPHSLSFAVCRSPPHGLPRGRRLVLPVPHLLHGAVTGSGSQSRLREARFEKLSGARHGEGGRPSGCEDPSEAAQHEEQRGTDVVVAACGVVKKLGNGPRDKHAPGDGEPDGGER